jgi:uncharacterized protein YdbL (DUF1318 family)
MKKVSTLVIIMLSVSCAFLTGCSSLPSCCVIAPPKIHLTGEKTVIERQIVGDYKEIEKDAWVISSVQTTLTRSEGSATVSAADKEIFRAMKIREYNNESIRTFKDDGAAGETFNGYVQYIANEKYDRDPDAKGEVQRILSEENSARKLIFQRTLLNSSQKEPTAEEIEAFGKLMAEEQAAAARKGDWIQDKSGRWIRK